MVILNRDDMVKRPLLVLLLLFTLSNTACSLLLKSEVLRVQKPVNTGWVLSERGNYRGYKFQYENVSVIVYDVLLTNDARFNDHWIVFVGPPLLPLIPFLSPELTQSYRDFLYRIWIESPTNATTIDLANIKISLSKGNPIQPSIA